MCKKKKKKQMSERGLAQNKCAWVFLQRLQCLICHSFICRTEVEVTNDSRQLPQHAFILHASLPSINFCKTSSHQNHQSPWGFPFYAFFGANSTVLKKELLLTYCLMEAQINSKVRGPRLCRFTYTNIF